MCLPAIIPVIAAAAFTPAIVGTTIGATLVGSIGATAATALIGAGVGALAGGVTSTMTGGKFGKGALMGAVSGGLTAGASSLMGGAAAPADAVKGSSATAGTGSGNLPGRTVAGTPIPPSVAAAAPPAGNGLLSTLLGGGKGKSPMNPGGGIDWIEMGLNGLSGLEDSKGGERDRQVARDRIAAAYPGHQPVDAGAGPTPSQLSAARGTLLDPNANLTPVQLAQLRLLTLQAPQPLMARG